MLQQLRANALAASALAVAISAMSISIVGLPHNSVGGKQIKKGAVHKSDIHPHAVTASKVGTGVLRMEGFASSEFSGSVPSNTPDVTLASQQITTTATGRIFGLARGTYSVECQLVSVVRAGIYIDSIPMVGSGAFLPSDGNLGRLDSFGATAVAVPPGTHTLALKADCANGDPDTHSTSGEAALAAIVIRN
jgi:hypothetical protein